MRKLSLFIIAASATLGVAVAQADDTIQPVEGPDAVTVEPEVIVDPVPEPEVTTTGEAVDPAPETDDIVMYPIDQVVELTDGKVVEDTAVDATGGDVTTDDGSAADDTGTKDDVSTTDDTELNPIMYSTTGVDTGTGTDTGPTRGTEGCMECRSLTGGTDSGAAEAPAPEVTADVLDGNATGVDVMDPAEARKRK